MSQDPVPEYILESQRPLSKSLLWQLQRTYFEQQGVRAWNTETVPSFITSNGFIANAYAQVVYGFVQDCRSSLNPNQPVYVMELGAGSGRFAFLFLKKWLEITQQAPTSPICYVITDFAASNLQFWQQHVAFRPFVEKGLLDFALFDTRHDQQVKLVESGQVLSAHTLQNPLVVLANYVFDSIEQDAFRVKDNILHESLLTLVSLQPEPNLNDPTLLSRLIVRYDHLPTTPTYYTNPAFNEILEYYRQALEDTAVSLPTGAFGVVDNLLGLGNGRLLLLTGDKGFGHEEELWQHTDPVPVNHGSFSLSVNFHAVGLYMEQKGGFALHTSPRDTVFAISAFLSGGTAAQFPTTCLAFQRHIESFGPMDFFAFQDGTKMDPPPKLSYLISLLRLSSWDPRLFYQLSDPIADQVHEAPENLKATLRRGLEKLWDNYFFIGDSRDVAFEIGRVYYRMRRFSDALRYYRHSLQLFGQHHITHLNMGVCYYELGLYPESLRCFNQSLALKEDYDLAKEWQQRIAAKLAR